jgi:hypothetical protein
MDRRRIRRNCRRYNYPFSALWRHKHGLKGREYGDVQPPVLCSALRRIVDGDRMQGGAELKLRNFMPIGQVEEDNRLPEGRMRAKSVPEQTSFGTNWSNTETEPLLRTRPAKQRLPPLRVLQTHLSFNGAPDESTQP